MSLSLNGDIKVKTCYLQDCDTVVKKPVVSLFLEPLYKKLKILEKGIEVQIYTNSGFIYIICRCILLTGILTYLNGH